MSAFVVSKLHIDMLVRAALHAGRAGDPFSWWQVDEEGNYAGWRQLDELADGTNPERVSPSQLGQLFLSENVRSVSHRYSEPGRTYYYGADVAGQMEDTPDEELPGPCDRFYLAPYVYTNPGYTLTPGELFKAIGCLRYQSCEHDGWRVSEAFACLDSLRDAYTTKVEGYEDAPWDWSPEDLDGRPQEFSRRLI